MTLIQATGSPSPAARVELLDPEAPDYREVVARVLGGSAGPVAHDEADRFLDTAACRGLQVAPAGRVHVDGRRPGTAVGIVSPGRSALLMLGAGSEAAPGAFRTLVEAVTTCLHGRGARLVQTLLDDQDAPASRVLHAAGHHYLTQLVYLERHMRRLPEPLRLAADVAWTRYEPPIRPQFIRLLEASYVDSADCRGLAGIRTTDDVLTGHAHSGDSGMDHWWLATVDSAPVGAVLLTVHRRYNVAEVVYMGVAHDARRRGVAHALLRRGLEEARALGVRCLTLAVDRANEPARRLYARWGFAHVLRRDAWIAVSHGGGS